MGNLDLHTHQSVMRCPKAIFALEAASERAKWVSRGPSEPSVKAGTFIPPPPPVVIIKLPNHAVSEKIIYVAWTSIPEVKRIPFPLLARVHLCEKSILLPPLRGNETSPCCVSRGRIGSHSKASPLSRTRWGQWRPRGD